MLTSLQNFDPVAFLEIDTSSMPAEELSSLKQSLMAKIGEYVLLKFAQNLTTEQMDDVMGVETPEKLMEKLGTVVPNMNQKMLEEMENFKNEYKAKQGV